VSEACGVVYISELDFDWIVSTTSAHELDGNQYTESGTFDKLVCYFVIGQVFKFFNNPLTEHTTRK